ncbi:hypothetical protein [Pseudomonas gingeri]|uniref:Uncharacterized protein n=1 Tax=Pseudomonas gingeri TaxID=117681 RepID=A0A7Y8CKZ7_9PSED|nr:hypothetical protein [Pseudomonas gingeri]NWB25807.1 hypothetical protein [Pseudomonas gingeri]NWC34581.1 hypothetical protein [Pseudomonas gingeri]
MERIQSNKPSMRYNLSTPDEADDWVLEQRENGRPVWAGPSFTMAQIWRMAKIVNATNLEMEAMGYAMYSYWNKAYPKEGTPVHRFHGAMATSEEFGIKYNPDADVEKNYAGFQQRLRFIPSKL